MTTRTLHTLQTTSTVHCGACSGDTLAFTLHLPPPTNIHHTHYYLLYCSAHWLRSCSSFNQPLTQPQGTVTCTLLCSSLHTLSLHTTSYCYRWWQHINKFGHWTGSWDVLSHNTRYRPLHFRFPPLFSVRSREKYGWLARLRPLTVHDCV